MSLFRKWFFNIWHFNAVALLNGLLRMLVLDLMSLWLWLGAGPAFNSLVGVMEICAFNADLEQLEYFENRKWDYYALIVRITTTGPEAAVQGPVGVRDEFSGLSPALNETESILQVLLAFSMILVSLERPRD